MLQVDALLAQLDAAFADLRDRCPWDEDLSAGNRGDRPVHGRVFLALETDDQIVDAADAAAGVVEQRAADDEREMQHMRRGRRERRHRWPSLFIATSSSGRSRACR